MNYLCVNTKHLISDQEIKVSDRETLRHLITILGKKIGDLIKIKVLSQGVGEAEIKSLDTFQAVLKLTKLEKVKDSKNITLAIGACRPLMMKRILEHGTTLGVRDFIFFNSYFSEKSYLDSKILIPENSEKYILKGLSQTKKYVDPPSLSVESKIEDIDLSSFAQKIYLHGPGQNYLSSSTSMNENLIVFIGGERGWHESELQYFKDQKVTEVAISESTLRVEFAMQAFMAQAEWVRNARR